MRATSQGPLARRMRRARFSAESVHFVFALKRTAQTAISSQRAAWRLRAERASERERYSRALFCILLCAEYDDVSILRLRMTQLVALASQPLATWRADAAAAAFLPARPSSPGSTRSAHTQLGSAKLCLLGAAGLRGAHNACLLAREARRGAIQLNGEKKNNGRHNEPAAAHEEIAHNRFATCFAVRASSCCPFRRLEGVAEFEPPPSRRRRRRARCRR